MHSIYITAAVTTLIAVAIFGSMLLRKQKKPMRKVLILLFLLQLPVSYLALEYIRIPIDNYLQSVLDTGKNLYLGLTTWYAPLTEEPAKLWPLLIPFFYKKLNKKNALAIGMALGLGFGIGEIWMLANKFSQVPEFAGFPWYYFGGFISERFLVTFLHATFTTIAVIGLTKKKWFYGIIIAIVAHYFLNFPIFLGALNLWGLPKEFWMIFSQIWVITYFISAIFLFAALALATKSNVEIYGKAKCPECKKVYTRSIKGLNFLHIRYEPCKHCKKWHFTKPYNGPAKKATKKKS